MKNRSLTTRFGLLLAFLAVLFNVQTNAHCAVFTNSKGLTTSLLKRFFTGLTLFLTLFSFSVFGQRSNLEGSNCYWIGGWVWDGSNSPSTVDLYVDGVKVLSKVANTFRTDLLNAGIGDGAHSFIFDTPNCLKDGQTHTIVVKAGSYTLYNAIGASLNCPGNGTGCGTTPPITTPTSTTVSLNPYSGDAYFTNGVVGINTTNVGDRSFPLSVRGKIRAQEIRVEIVNWPDYVFAPDYKLPSLQETALYLKINRHLPGIPSAQDVADKGVLLGDMNARLLRQVEELTLHLIQIENRSRWQEAQIKRLQTATHSNR